MFTRLSSKHCKNKKGFLNISCSQNIEEKVFHGYLHRQQDVQVTAIPAIRSPKDQTLQIFLDLKIKHEIKYN